MNAVGGEPGLFVRPRDHFSLPPLATRQVGVVAEIRECEFLSDGRVLVEAIITDRFSVADHWVEPGTQNLHYARITLFDDEEEAEDTSEMEQELATAGTQHALPKTRGVGARPHLCQATSVITLCVG